MKNICIDARLMTSKLNGLGQYALQLMDQMSKIDAAYIYNIFIGNEEHYQNKFESSKNIKIFQAQYNKILSLQNLFFKDRVISKLNCDLYHSLYHFLPKKINAKKSVVTIHDMMWLDSPELTLGHFKGAFFKPFAKFGFDKTFKLVDHVIAISEHTKRRLIHYYPFLEKKISVISHGSTKISEQVKCPDERLIKNNFILSIGNSRPYKNVPRCLEAFSKLDLEKEGKLYKKYFVICGRGDHVKSLKKLTQKLKISDRVIFLGHVSNEEIEFLYQKALFLCFPSIIEGFGLPIIEALSRGCPVLTSNTPPMNEICGESAVLVDPLDVLSIKRGFEKLILDASFRASLISQGVKHSIYMNWERAAIETLKVYENLLS